MTILGSQLIFGFTLFMPAPLDRFIFSICGRCLNILETGASLGSGFMHGRHMDTSKYTKWLFLDILDDYRLSTYLRAHYNYASPSRSLHKLYMWTLSKHFKEGGLVGVRIYARKAYGHIKIQKMHVSWTSLTILGSQLILGLTIFMPAPLDRFIYSICGS